MTISFTSKKEIKSFSKDYHIPLYAIKSYKVYFSNLFNCYILDYYKDKEHRFPLNGWFKGCIFCNVITGHFYEHKHNKSYIIIPMCRGCKCKIKTIKYKLLLSKFLKKIKYS